MEVLAEHVKYNNYILVLPGIGKEVGGEQCDEWGSCKTPLVTKMNYRVVTRQGYHGTCLGQAKLSGTENI
jgi:hypothetical protein